MRRSEWGARLALVALGLVLAVLALEVVLQLGAAVVRLTRDERSAIGTAGSRRILCLGDSNTYGVWLEQREVEAWPAQLKAIWPRDGSARPIEVLNAGYPGTNSSQLLRQFPGMLEAFDPELVIVMVGANDFWTEPVEIEPGAEESATGLLRRHSRVFRAYRLLRRRLQPTEVEVVRESEGKAGFESGSGVVRFGDHEFAMGWKRGTPGEGAPGRALEQNLLALVKRAQTRGVELVLMTYPSAHGLYGNANPEIRAAAAEGGARLVDLEAVFRPLCPRAECPTWLYRDQHPRASGYRLVAETVVEALSREASP